MGSPRVEREGEKIMAFTILHVEPLHSLSEIGDRGDHILRQYQPLNADPVRTHLNQILVGPEHGDLAQTAAEKIGIQRLRKDARRAGSMLLSASRAAFLSEAGDLDPAKIDAWTKLNMEWLNRKYGDNVISAAIHMDEQTPHIHALIIPLRQDGSLSYKAMFGEPAILRNLQTDYAKAVASLGIERGVENSTARHEDVSAYYARVNAVQTAIPVQELED
jgi:hypothetical protein